MGLQISMILSFDIISKIPLLIVLNSTGVSVINLGQAFTSYMTGISVTILWRLASSLTFPDDLSSWSGAWCISVQLLEFVFVCKTYSLQSEWTWFFCDLICTAAEAETLHPSHCCSAKMKCWHTLVKSRCFSILLFLWPASVLSLKDQGLKILGRFWPGFSGLYYLAKGIL